MNINPSRKNAARGAAWLDRVKPGWEDLIDFGTLYMRSGRDCIAGQVFRAEGDARNLTGFDYAMSRAPATSHWYGFQPAPGIRLAWKKEARKRRRARSAGTTDAARPRKAWEHTLAA